jgi:preprotein translocase subunit SecD
MLLVLLAMAACTPASTPKGRSPARAKSAAVPPNGLYAVVREASTRDSALVEGSRHLVMVYDRRYTESDPATPAEYVALDTTTYVPLILSGPPDASKDGRGWTMLSVTLAPEQVKPLEDFTAARLGGTVAIVLDGEVISTHRVRAVVQGGRLQITRCGDNACDVLLAKLTK